MFMHSLWPNGTHHLILLQEAWLPSWPQTPVHNIIANEELPNTNDKPSIDIPNIRLIP